MTLSELLQTVTAMQRLRFTHSTAKIHTSFLPPCQCHSRREKPQAGRGAAASSALMARRHAATACQAFMIRAGGLLWEQLTS